VVSSGGVIPSSRKKWRDVTQEPSNPTRPWDRDKELRNFIENNDELSAIYRKLGYSVHVDQESQRILNQLKSLAGTAIVDPTPSGFGRLLYDARNVRFSQLHERAHKIDFDAPRKAGKRGRVSLNKQTKQENPEKLKAFLNRHPNAVRAISLLLLDKLEELFKDAHSPLNTRGREALLSAVTEVRMAVRDRERERDRMLRFLLAEDEDSRRASLYFKDPANALNSLDRARDHWCRLVQDFFDDDPAHERKAQLDELLSNSLWVREIRGQDDAGWHKQAAEQAKAYINSSWMHTPWLTARFLTDLLDVELAPLNREAKSVGEFDLMLMSIIWRVPPLSYYWRFKVARERGRLARLARLLEQVRDEVDSGNYDAQEIAERLRRYEGEEMYVHSLVYALLRLNSPNA
jgi:hypothetical protein